MDRNEKGNFMKNMHFCTNKNLKKFKLGKKGEYIITIRTGWIPQIFTGDIIKLNKRLGKQDIFSRMGKIISVTPIKFKNLNTSYKEEIQKYKRKFHPEQYFFRIIIKFLTTGDEK